MWTVDPEKLLAYDLTLAEVGEALRRNNLNVGGNILERAKGSIWCAASACCRRSRISAPWS